MSEWVSVCVLYNTSSQKYQGFTYDITFRHDFACPIAFFYFQVVVKCWSLVNIRGRKIWPFYVSWWHFSLAHWQVKGDPPMRSWTSHVSCINLACLLTLIYPYLFLLWAILCDLSPFKYTPYIKGTIKIHVIILETSFQTSTSTLSLVNIIVKVIICASSSM